MLVVRGRRRRQQRNTHLVKIGPIQVGDHRAGSDQIGVGRFSCSHDAEATQLKVVPTLSRPANGVAGCPFSPFPS